MESINNKKQPDVIIKSAQSRLEKWNVHTNLSKDGTTIESFRQILKSNEDLMSYNEHLITPDSFNGNDEKLSALPRQLNWHWNSCENLLKHFDSKIVMANVPTFWQMEPLIHKVCYLTKTTVFPSQPKNIPVGLHAIQSIPIDTVISAVEDASILSLSLIEKKYRIPKSWVLIHHYDGEWEIPFSLKENVSVAQEIHLAPGVPILEQCPDLISRKTPSFHMSNDFFWEITKDSTLITSLEYPLPFIRLNLPFILDTHGKCTCGRVIVKKKHVNV